MNGEERKKLWTESNRWLNERGSEKVSIQSFDGLTLRGEFFEGEGEPDSTVFLVHGYRCNRRREYAVIARFYLEAGYNVLLADDRAHGESDGRYIGFGILDREDCYRWVRFLDERFHGKQKIFLHGISMGAAAVLMASNLCLPMSVRGIVEDCGFTSPGGRVPLCAETERKRLFEPSTDLSDKPVLQGLCRLWLFRSFFR
ncbi:MAG: alpha/beta hydrolase [Blautia sp.]